MYTFFKICNSAVCCPTPPNCCKDTKSIDDTNAVKAESSQQ